MTDSTKPIAGEFDVAVVGAGPMGSFAAQRMAQAGLSVALLEKDANPGDSTVCAGGMHHDLVRFLNLPSTVIEKVLPAFRYTLNGRNAEWRFGDPTYVTVERRRLDVLLAERAVQAGAKLYTGTRVVGAVPEKGTLFCESGDDERLFETHAKVFVFADGANSLARRILTPASRAGSRPQFVGLEYDLEAPANSLDALEIIPDPKNLPFGYLWVFPKRDHINVGLARLDSMSGPTLNTLLSEFIATRPDLRGQRVMRRKGGVIPASLNPVLQKDNWLVIGDAAGMVNPLTGGGYVCGFVSAAIAAETCIDAFRGGSFQAKAMCKYQSRLRWTKHYIVVRLMHIALSVMTSTYRAINKPVWLPFLRVYFSAVHIAMRFIPVI